MPQFWLAQLEGALRSLENITSRLASPNHRTTPVGKLRIASTLRGYPAECSPIETGWFSYPSCCCSSRWSANCANLLLKQTSHRHLATLERKSVSGDARLSQCHAEPLPPASPPPLPLKVVAVAAAAAAAQSCEPLSLLRFAASSKMWNPHLRNEIHKPIGPVTSPTRVQDFPLAPSAPPLKGSQQIQDPEQDLFLSSRRSSRPFEGIQFVKRGNLLLKLVC